ncbi:ArsR family transcriptional regulator [Natrinema thermotolerans DSM 11552]|nr:ArsR family transcriptional regulator [Natrinema thermotolerans DSM 11552]
MPDQQSRPFKDLSPSAKLVYKVLEYEGKLTQQELREETLLSQRTIYNSIRDLEEISAIDSHPCREDLRKTVYYMDNR